MKEKAQFLPIEVDDNALERLAQKKGVPEIVKPAADERRNPAPRVEQQAPAMKRTNPSQRSPYRSLSIELPEYVWKDIKLRAVHRNTSLRHVILSGLVLLGVEIAEADMIEDGRRLRGSNDAG
ncbi:MAG TPA: hypothetical protein PKY73_15765 [Hyphomonas sp.]|jgi:hypothetical protein|nr:hypothetical protein [Hyphomonas sp.]